MIKNQKGFSLVELLVVVIIMALLSGVAYVGIQAARVKLNNNKVADDLLAEVNALEAFAKDNQGLFPLPQPGSNQNVQCFSNLGAYVHDCLDPSVAFRQGVIDNNLLTKRYLQEVPVDPRSGNLYAYGVTSDGRYFMVAGLFETENGHEARTRSSLTGDAPFPSLIRSYNSPQFVTDRGQELPYSPDPFILTATAREVTGAVTANGAPVVSGDVFTRGDTLKTGPGSQVTLHLSDGSIASLSENSELTLKSLAVDQNDQDGIVTRVRLKLNLGKLWNKVVRLSKGSEFSVETTGAVAAVRGTEFGVDSGSRSVTVRSGRVEIQDTQGNPKGMIDDGAGGDVKPAMYRKATLDNQGNILFTVNADPKMDPEARGTEQTYYQKEQLTIQMTPRIFAVVPQGGNALVTAENLYRTLGTDPLLHPLDLHYLRADYELPDGKPFTYYQEIKDPWNGGNNYDLPPLDLSLGDLSSFRIRFEKVGKGPNGKVIETFTAWSAPVTLQGGATLLFEGLNPGASPRPRLTAEAFSALIPLNSNETPVDIQVNLDSFDFAAAIKKDQAFPGLPLVVTDSEAVCAFPGVMLQAPRMTLKGRAEIRDPMVRKATCKLTLQVTLPNNEVVKTATELPVRRQDPADQAGTPPSLNMLGNPVKDRVATIRYQLGMGVHTFTSLRFFDQQGAEIFPNPAVDKNSSQAVLDLKDRVRFPTGPNAITLRLDYTTPLNKAEFLEWPLLLPVTDPTALRIGFVDPNTNELYPNPPKPEVGKPFKVKVVLFETTSDGAFDIQKRKDITKNCVMNPAIDPMTDEITFNNAGQQKVICDLQSYKDIKVPQDNSLYAVVDGQLNAPRKNVNITELEAEVQPPMKKLADVCTTTPGIKGVLKNNDTECWILADKDSNQDGKNDSCKAACDNLGVANNLNNISCDPGNWNDDNLCTICKGLTGAGGCQKDQVIPNLAPFFHIMLNSCRYRDTNIALTQNCSDPVPDLSKQRICKCEQK